MYSYKFSAIKEVSQLTWKWTVKYDSMALGNSTAFGR